jgi:hypothetical protein
MNYPSRFLVRQGYNGWMVYDRQRKGPALIETDFAVDLTIEEAYRVKQMLAEGKHAKGKHSDRSRP